MTPARPGVNAKVERRPGRPRDSELDAVILKAAIELLCQEGFAGTTVEAVAERAGVGKATIYRRWPTREDLLLAAGGSTIVCPSRPDTGSLRQDLIVLARGLMAMLTTTPVGRLLPATVAEVARNPELRTRLDAFIDDRRAPVRQVLAQAATRGELAEGIDHELIVDLMSGPIFTRVLLTGRPLEEGLAEGIVDAVLAGVLAPKGT
ncbi:MAG: TetR/AcrR family transcriptional regulator [Acidimicrobiales bacterium]